MRKFRNGFIAAFAAIGMLVMILDSELVLTGAVTGIELCLWTVVPSLFPFFVVSAFINSNIGSKGNALLRAIGKLCRMPAGSESILIIGCLGGYPIGAQSTIQAYHSGRLPKQDASRMLAFCNNAGPAFIFGMVSQLFHSASVGWYLWLITVLSSILVAMSIPGRSTSNSCTHQPTPISLPQLISNSVKAMANVCAWVTLFRILLTLLQERVFHNCYPLLQTVLFGFLELSNGVILTSSISDPGIRFVLCAIFLNAGGLCVAMQTHSIAKGLRLRSYFIGKALQTLYSLLLSLMLMPIIFSAGNLTVSLISCAICVTFLLFAQVFKKSIAISEKILYYIEN